MKTVISAIISFSLSTFSFGSSSNQYKVYKIKSGDTLSELLQGRTIGPLYSKDGIVDQSLKLNRLDNQEAKKLEVGSYVILPSKPAIVTDSTSLTQAAIYKNGILSQKISHHQTIEFSANFSSKNFALKNGGKVIFNQNISGQLKVSGNQKGKPFVALTAESINGVLIEDKPSEIVELKPNYGIDTGYFFYESKAFELGALVGLQEASSVGYDDDNYEVRRDQHIWFGAQMAKTLTFKKFQLDIHGELKNNTVSHSLTSDSTLNLSEVSIFGRVNLTRDYFGSVFSRIEFGDREGRSFGFGFTYKL